CSRSGDRGGGAGLVRRRRPGPQSALCELNIARLRDTMNRSSEVIEWLMASDPAIRWQVMRDLLDAPQADWTVERGSIETDGWGAMVLTFEDEDGQWAGGAFVPRGFTPKD